MGDVDQTVSQGSTRIREQAGHARLLVVEGSTSSLIELPDKGLLLIGRAAEADIRLTDRSVSRRHARLLIEGEVRIADLESHNGVRVNGERLSGVRTLSPGDVVSVGDVTLVLYAASGEHAPPSQAAQATELVLGERTVLVAEPAMLRLYELIRRLAPSELPVLICGESGAGKENAAFAVHHWSPRTAQPFLAINCANISESLAESELFGHEKGAFTGAITTKAGLLEAASGGTLFLDEVGELPLPVQAKLLRVLETRRFIRVGGTREREVDLRIVAATHRNLEQEVAAGRFRQDLFFRMGVAKVVLPPLRDRRSELRLLAERFLATASAGQPGRVLAPATLEALERYPWPGNVRELKSAMVYAAATAPGPVVEPHHLPEHIVARLQAAAPQAPAPAAQPTAPTVEMAAARPGQPLSKELQELERERMVEALRAAGGVKTRAAELLGMPVRTFTFKCKKYGL